MTATTTTKAVLKKDRMLECMSCVSQARPPTPRRKSCCGPVSPTTLILKSKWQLREGALDQQSATSCACWGEPVPSLSLTCSPGSLKSTEKCNRRQQGAEEPVVPVEEFCLGSVAQTLAGAGLVVRRPTLPALRDGGHLAMLYLLTS